MFTGPASTIPISPTYGAGRGYRPVRLPRHSWFRPTSGLWTNGPTGGAGSSIESGKLPAGSCAKARRPRMTGRAPIPMVKTAGTGLEHPVLMITVVGPVWRSPRRNRGGAGVRWDEVAADEGGMSPEPAGSGLAAFRPGRAMPGQPSATGPANDVMTCSVGIMAYNEQANIADAIGSILDQQLTTTTVAELIVVASGCEDQTVAIVSDIARRDSRIRLIEQEQREGKAFAGAGHGERGRPGPGGRFRRLAVPFPRPLGRDGRWPAHAGQR